MNKKIKRIFAVVLSLLMLAGLSMLTACDGDGKEPEEPVTIVYEGGALPAAEVTVSYSASVATATGADEITYTMSKGALPSGLTLATDGTLSGKPAKDGDFSFTVKATAGTASATADFTLTVNKHYYEITYSGSVLPAATVDEAYTASVATATTTGTEPIAYSTEDTLPAGLALAADGTISGTPTEATDGALSFTVTASAEDAHPVTATFSLTVAEGEAIVLTYKGAALADARVGEAYTASVATAAGAENIEYTLYEGSSLPAGLTLGKDGTLSGTPSGDSASYSFTVLASADGAIGATAQFTLFVKPAQAMTKYTFEAEWTDLSEFQGVGISGSCTGTEAIEESTAEVSNCSNGYYVGWTHSKGITVTFVINSDAATTAKLSLSIGSEGTPMEVSSSNLEVSVNGTDIDYDLGVYVEQDDRYVIFDEYEIAANVSLNEGENTIVLTIADNKLGNGDEALGFMIDALFLETDAFLSWTPQNTEFTHD